MKIGMKIARPNPDRVVKLPPLILHPFSDSASPHKLVQSSRANLMLQGLIPQESFSTEQLEDMLLEGRFCELRMLFYVGKDVVRWIDQCVEVVEREPDLAASEVVWQSFASLVVEDPPEPVKEKLKSWGVADYRAIFARGLGLNAVFAEVPDRIFLGNEFVRNYHAFADNMFTVVQSARPFLPIRSKQFPFDLFASGEYSRILEREWQDSEA